MKLEITHLGKTYNKILAQNSITFPYHEWKLIDFDKIIPELNIFIKNTDLVIIKFDSGGDTNESFLLHIDDYNFIKKKYPDEIMQLKRN